MGRTRLLQYASRLTAGCPGSHDVIHQQYPGIPYRIARVQDHSSLHILKP